MVDWVIHVARVIKQRATRFSLASLLLMMTAFCCLLGWRVLCLHTLEKWHAAIKGQEYRPAFSLLDSNGRRALRGVIEDDQVSSVILQTEPPSRWLALLGGTGRASFLVWGDMRNQRVEDCVLTYEIPNYKVEATARPWGMAVVLFERCDPIVISERFLSNPPCESGAD